MPARGQTGAAGGEWRTYGGDLASTRYAPLDQINAGNFNKLEVAWRFQTDSLGPRLEFNLQVTPLMVNGKSVLTAGRARAPSWRSMRSPARCCGCTARTRARAAAAARRVSCRGAAWPTGPTARQERILYVTPGYQMVALDAKRCIGSPGSERTASSISSRTSISSRSTPSPARSRWHAAPVIAEDVIIIGAAHLAGGAPKSKTHEKGYVRGFDVRTGKRLWTFHTIPRPGEFGNDTWLNDSGRTPATPASGRR